MNSKSQVEVLENGLTVIVQEIPHLESVSYSLHIPAGVLTDSADTLGSSLILIELTSRGAGDYDSRALLEEFDSQGIRHSESSGVHSTTYSGSLISEKLEDALRLVSLMTCKATLPSDEIEPIKSLLVQDIHAMFDNPSRRVMVELRKQYLPEPYNRPSLGVEEGILNTTAELLESDYKKRFTPHGAVLSIAGKVDTPAVFDMARRHFGDWSGEVVKEPEFGTLPDAEAHHIELDSAQLQIALAYPGARFGDDDYYVGRVANGILSGGMFGRLFIEVREKRGLCYSVYSQHSGNHRNGTTMVYAGTTPERAQETLDVVLHELRGVKGSVSDEELKRAKANIKSSLVMSQESPGARSGSNATDWWWLKRVRTLEEIEVGIDSVTADMIDSYIEKYPANNFMLVTLGSKELTFSEV